MSYIPQKSNRHLWAVPRAARHLYLGSLGLAVPSPLKRSGRKMLAMGGLRALGGIHSSLRSARSCSHSDPILQSHSDWESLGLLSGAAASVAAAAAATEAAAAARCSAKGKNRREKEQTPNH